MGAALENHNHMNSSYTGLANDRNNESLSENMSSHNTSDYKREISYIIQMAVDITILVICFLGLVGNGIVIWLLGFRMKRNPFSIYILNLSVADFGVLVSVSIFILGRWLMEFYQFYILLSLFFCPFSLMYSTSQFLLTAISVDRCVAVFFPLWHRCRKPPSLSTIVCALIWLLSFLLTTITCTVTFLDETVQRNDILYLFFVNALLCLPVMTISTLSLFIKACLKARQPRRGKLLTIILLTLLFFLLFAFPLNPTYTLHFFNKSLPYLLTIDLLLACFNSSVNPAIYFLVGREWKSRRRETVKMIFQKVFKEEEGCAEETPTESQ